MVNLADFKKGESIRDFLLRDSGTGTRIGVRKDPNPDIARIIIAGPWDGDGQKASALLHNIAGKWAGHPRTDFLITPGGFIRFPWPEEVPCIGDAIYPDRDAVADLTDAAQRAVDAFLTPDLCDELNNYTRCLTIGADSRGNKNEIEFVCVCDLESGKMSWTGKSYPNTGQESRLVRITDLSSHFLPLLDQSALVLGSHDLHIFNNRVGGWENLSAWRRETREEMKQLALEKRPTIILQHPHTTDSSRTWPKAWSGLLEKVPTANCYASAGLYYKEGDPCRSPLARVLSATKMGATIDFIHPVAPLNVENFGNGAVASGFEISPL